MSGAGAPSRSHRTRALLLRKVEHAESDLVLTLFTEKLGRISCLARGARKSQKRFGGALEPFQTLAIEVDERTSSEFFFLRGAAIDVPRLALTSDLDRMDAAGRALHWVRTAAPPRTAEPELWKVVTSLLDRLNAEGAVSARLVLAEEALRLLSALGWGLELERCVKCGRPCATGQAAAIDTQRGGLVCRQCGGAALKLSGAVRERLLSGILRPEDAELAIDLVERALRAHVGIA